MQNCSCGGASASSRPQHPAAAALETFFGSLGRKRAGMAPAGCMEGCDTLWGAPPIELAPGASGTLTWPTTGVFFSQFAPVAAIINVTARGRNSAIDSASGTYVQSVEECCLDDLVQIDAVSYQGSQRLASTDPINLSTFRCCNTHLGLACLGVIEVSSNDLTIDLTNISDPAAVLFDVQVSGTLVGWSVQSGALETALGLIDCMDPGKRPGWLGGGALSGEVRFKANVGGTQPGGRPGGAPGSAYPPVP